MAGLLAVVLLAALWMGGRVLRWTLRLVYIIYSALLLQYMANHGGWNNDHFGDESVMSFAYHPTFMVLSFQILGSEALLLFRGGEGVLSRRWRKIAHASLNGLFLFFAVGARCHGALYVSLFSTPAVLLVLEAFLSNLGERRVEMVPSAFLSMIFLQ